MPVIDYDCEFARTSGQIDLVSIGMVDDRDRRYYAISRECDLSALLADGWLMRNVVSALPLTRTTGPDGDFLAWDPDKPDFDKVKTRAQIAREVEGFVLDTAHRGRTGMLPHVELWANYGAYDHVALCQLFGTMMDLPEGFPRWSHDIQQEAERLGLSDKDLPQQASGQHNALADALHQQEIRRWLARRAEYQS